MTLLLFVKIAFSLCLLIVPAWLASDAGGDCKNTHP